MSHHLLLSMTLNTFFFQRDCLHNENSCRSEVILCESPADSLPCRDRKSLNNENIVELSEFEKRIEENLVEAAGSISLPGISITKSPQRSW